MSVELLDKTRRINRLLQDKLDNHRLIFNDFCSTMGIELESNVYVISQKGKILGAYITPENPMFDSTFSSNVGDVMTDTLNRRFNAILSTKENFNLETLGFARDEVKGVTAIVTPILISGVRRGHLFLYRKGESYSIEDIIISEFGSTVIGLETMRAQKEENDHETSQKNTVESAIHTLSESEFIAIKRIFQQIDGTEAVLVTSRIADNLGITRSIIINALRKLESAGIIETKSSGMKGTFIKVVNNYIYKAIEL